MKARQAGSRLFRSVLDFALPPRCGGCGAIVEELDSFCPDCWRKLEFLQGGCVRCGLPLQGTDAETCAACLARPPRLDRIRAAVAYDDISRSIALRLKYGRKTALARTMSRYMGPLIGELPSDALLVPAPLHRRRLWSVASTNRRSSPGSCRGEPEWPWPSTRSGESARLRRSRAWACASAEGPSPAPSAPMDRRSFAGERSFWSTTCSPPGAPPTPAPAYSSAPVPGGWT